MAQSKIKTLDIQNFYSSDIGQKSAFVEELQASFREIGFVIIKGHKITHELQEKSYQAMKEFFALPEEKKMKYHVPGIGGARGYTPFGKEHAKNHNVGDLKEFFHVGVEVPSDHPLKKVYPDNVGVSEVANFDAILRNLYSGLLELGTDVLRALAMSLKLDPEYFTEYVQYGNSILRPIHYPPIADNVEPKALRSAPHEDINLITLLIGASNPGLEAKSRSGEWIPVQTKADEIVINVGDMLQRLTNYHYISTTHQVVNPKDPAKLRESRLSVPFFLHPVSEMSLKALPQCVSEATPQRDPDTTAGEYLNQRLKEIGLI
jgi:isopenicillin N synthase-like dioxygenase